MKTYLIFKRFTLTINPNDEYYFKLEIVKDTQNDFIKFINELVKYSKAEQSYINVYKIKGKTMNKIAWIKKGELYTL